VLAFETVEAIVGDEDSAAIATYLTGLGDSRVLDITRVGHFDCCAFHHASFLFRVIRGRPNAVGGVFLLKARFRNKQHKQS
jgi:hypothetical protein